MKCKDCGKRIRGKGHKDGDHHKQHAQGNVTVTDSGTITHKQNFGGHKQ